MNKPKTLQTLTDRIAIRDLVDAYAKCADTRDAEGQMALFTKEADFLIYYDPKSPKPSQSIKGREKLRPIFEALKTYNATMHFNGQMIVNLGHDKATGETYCLAHHLTLKDGKQHFMVAAIRYFDVFAKENGKWLFEERKLLVDWIENR